MSDERSGGGGAADGGVLGAAGPTRGGETKTVSLYGAAAVLLFFCVSILIFEGQDTPPRLSYKMLK